MKHRVSFLKKKKKRNDWFPSEIKIPKLWKKKKTKNHISSGMLCRTGFHERRLLLAALKICLLRNKFSRCSNDKAGGAAVARRPQPRRSLIASSTCFRSSFFTTIFIRPSAAVISPPPNCDIASRILHATGFWFTLPDLESLNSLLRGDDFSSISPFRRYGYASRLLRSVRFYAVNSLLIPIAFFSC